MRISVSKKIVGMVISPILFICLVVGFVSSNIMTQNIIDEIEIQLKTGAYSVGQILELCTEMEEVNKDIVALYEKSGIDVTVFSADAIRVASTIDGAIGTSMDSHILEELKTGKDYFAIDANVNGEPYFGYYIPFFVNGQFNGATFTGIPQLEANTTIMHSIVKIVCCIIACGLIAVIVAIFMVRGIVKNINGLQNTIGTLLDNDLSVKHEKYDFEHDEVEEICNKTVDFSEHLNKIITIIKSASIDLKEIASDLNTNVQFTNDTCNQISQAVENVANGAVSQAEDTTNAAQNISEMSDELSRIKSNANDLHTIANSMDNEKNNALSTLVDLQKVNEIIVEEVSSTSRQVNATSESVEQIKKAVEMIQDIADQTKLLSLNASIEASHAGEHGKGFSVVAEEIGKLASQSAQSSDEIEEILKHLVKNYNIIIQNVKNTSDNMEVQNARLIETQNVFNVLERGINSTVNSITEINSMVEHLDVEIGRMVDVVSDLSAISEENSASTEQIMASVQELTAIIGQVLEKATNVNESADGLLKEVNVFKIA